MALTCPQCAAVMKEVAAPANVGYAIMLDQCPRCGGIWCDRWELYPVTTAAAQQLDRIDQEAFRAPAYAASKAMECPRCRARLRRFRDPSLPPDACIERCPNCDGMWMNRGELHRFKQREIVTGSLGAAQIDRVAQASDLVPPQAVPVRHLADALDAPDPAVDEEPRYALASAAGWLVLRSLLRLLFRV